MDGIYKSKWIKIPEGADFEVGLYKKKLDFDKVIVSASLNITARGVYEAFIDGVRVGDFILAPGCTEYNTRLQVQTYDVTGMLKNDSELTFSISSGWYYGNISREKRMAPGALLACLDIEFADGTKATVGTDESWLVSPWCVQFSDIYDGEVYDANVVCDFVPVEIFDFGKDTLIPTEGEKIIEYETLVPTREILTPKGERVIDFGQEITGYVSFEVTAKAGERIVIDHAEVLDSEGNFYRDNLRSAKAQITYICKDGVQSYKPHHTFFGFRYIRLNECPENIAYTSFKAIVVHSEMKRTGYFECSNEKLNKLYSNLVWGQRGNFLDIPTDCPQRDERQGWTGDAQVFVKTAAYNYDVNKFFKKWLRDLKAEQTENGAIPHTVPDIFNHPSSHKNADYNSSAAWADAVCVCPWQMYLSYGDTELLREMLPVMERYIEHIRKWGDNEYTWQGGSVFGDWLSLEDTDKNFIADAYYAYSTSILIKAKKALGEDACEYEKLYENIVSTFRKNHTDYRSQTECVLALHFGLCEDKKATADKLAELIKSRGNALTTGFVGTPYLLHALRDNGYGELAYTLMLREDYPSWLFSVNMGATTIWEHWDGIREDGSFWSDEMNSFNHYAYGSVGDFMYGDVCGIKPMASAPGYREFEFAPIVDTRLDYAKMEYECKYGKIKAGWKKKDGGYEYHLTVPEGTKAHVKINGREMTVGAGEYTF